MFFAKPYQYTPCGMYSAGHLVLFLVTVSAVALGLYASRRMDEARVRRTVRAVTVLRWVMEVAKILFVLAVTESRNPNDFLPLYYCSLVLYAGALSSLGRGVWRLLGDAFLATGGVVGGACFLVVPNTSLPRYPAFHFISFHSFILHGLMVYLGLLLLVRGVYRIRLRDIRYPAGVVSVMCVLAFAFNTFYNRAHPENPSANLMFLSLDFPGTPVSILYRITGPIFPIAMWLIQAFGPFLLFCGLQAMVLRIKKKVVSKKIEQSAKR